VGIPERGRGQFIAAAAAGFAAFALVGLFSSLVPGFIGGVIHQDSHAVQGAVVFLIYEVILREIPELHGDEPVLDLLSSSVHSNIDTCLQIMQHQIDLSAVQAPAASLEYARRRAQRGTPLTALLRAYRLGHTCFSDWLLKELARQADDVQMITAATLGCLRSWPGTSIRPLRRSSRPTRERERWLRNRSAARAGRIRNLLSGQRMNVSATEATLGQLRQYHVGLVCWAGDATSPVDNITWLEHAISHVAGEGSLRWRSCLPAPRRIERLGLAAAGQPGHV
jgi:hypothetical protein